jgi:threonylcarbamoyladenosine tRNA methylthiotransferase CDKAL1
MCRLIFNLLQVDHVKTVVTEGVPEIWLSSEDTGAYGNLDVQFFLGLLIVDTCGNYMVIYFRLAKFPGRDVGTNLTNLLTAIVAELRVFLRGYRSFVLTRAQCSA